MKLTLKQRQAIKRWLAWQADVQAPGSGYELHNSVALVLLKLLEEQEEKKETSS